MVKVIYEYDVAIEKQEEYLKVTREKIKPLWESKGCQSYDVWQVADSETRFIKEALFENESVMKGMKGILIKKHLHSGVTSKTHRDYP